MLSRVVRRGSLAGCALLLLGATGCKRRCESEAPSFEVSVRFDPGVPEASLKTLVISVRAGAFYRPDVVMSLEGKLESRQSSFAVVLGAEGQGGFEARVSSVAKDAQGQSVAWGEATFKGSGDACNFFSMTLTGVGPPRDGRPDRAPDHRTDGMAADRGKDSGSPVDKTTLYDTPSPPPPDMKVVDKAADRPPDKAKDKPSSEAPTPLKTCAQLYGTVPMYTLCSETPTSCMFYTSPYPSSNTCNTVCTSPGGTCIGASASVGWATQTERCTVAGTVTCSTSSTAHICVCTRVP